MKKVIIVFAALFMTVGFTASTNDSAAEEEQLFIDATDDDEIEERT